MTKNVKLPVTNNEEGQMAVIPCARCGLEHVLTNNYSAGGYERSPHHDDRLRGVLTCGRCHIQTVFEVTDNTVTFLPGEGFGSEVQQAVVSDAAEMFREAILCYHGSSYRGTVAMCRAAVEEVLDNCFSKNKIRVRSKRLDSMIRKAKANKILGYEQVSHAHSARLVGNKALHRASPVSQLEAQIALGTAVELLNQVATWKPLPVAQSAKGNSVP